MTRVQLGRAAMELMELLVYKSAPKTERGLDPALFAFLQARFGGMTRQIHLRMKGYRLPQRIDFRHGTNNFVFIEFAVRSPDGGSQLGAKQNHHELRKLTRVPPSEASMRVLLLMDLASSCIGEKTLRDSYAALNAGPGKFNRSPVSIIYVHRKLDAPLIFRWLPYSQ